MRPYKEFWPIYLGAHRGVWTQRIHLFASILGAIGVASAVAMEQPLLAPAGILVAMGIAFSSHFILQGNHPTFALNPLWSAVGDVHMCFLLVTGRLPAEMRRLGLAPLEEGLAARAVRANKKP